MVLSRDEFELIIKSLGSEGAGYDLACELELEFNNEQNCREFIIFGYQHQVEGEKRDKLTLSMTLNERAAIKHIAKNLGMSTSSLIKTMIFEKTSSIQ